MKTGKIVNAGRIPFADIVSDQMKDVEIHEKRFLPHTAGGCEFEGGEQDQSHREQ